jgi:hypothetical protein
MSMLSKLLSFFSPKPQRRVSSARRSAMQKDPGPTTVLQLLEAEEPANWNRWRTPERDMDRVLSSNRIALCWDDPELTARLFNELLLDKRGKRRGFAPAVAEDLLRLRVHHGRMFALESSAVWQMQTVAVSDRDSSFARLGRPMR